jgi:hypothetical protein
MANWLLPTTGSTYINYTAELDGRLDDLAYGLDPAITTVTNPQTNMVRWSSAVSKWQKYNGTAWVDLVATYAINAATASAWQTGRTISLTGDATATSAAWTGSGNISLAVTLPTVNSNVGSFGSTSAIPVLTVNGKGLVTAVSTVALGTMATQGAGAVAITGGSIAGTTFTLAQSTTAAPTAEGRMEWDTDDDVLKIGTGAATKTVVNTDNTQTLTNKTLSTGSTWSGNTIAVASGGTGATDAATARTNLGITQSADAHRLAMGGVGRLHQRPHLATPLRASSRRTVPNPSTPLPRTLRCHRTSQTVGDDGRRRRHPRRTRPRRRTHPRRTRRNTGGV